jgi:hypothetical protein
MFYWHNIETSLFVAGNVYAMLSKSLLISAFAFEKETTYVA